MKSQITLWITAISAFLMSIVDLLEKVEIL